MPPTSGAELSERFYREMVGPLVRAEFPGLRHAAGRWGSGSDVLGLDDATSRDHDWGCRLTLLVDAADAAVIPELDRRLEERLPYRFADLPVRFAMTWDQRVRHKIWVDTVTGFASSRLGVDAAAMTAADWLLVTGQSVLEVTAGPVFADLPALAALRERLAWYPDQVWRYVLAAGWERVGACLPMLYRTALRGDPLGPRLLAADAVGDLIHLAYLLERRWEPYRKWSGLVFATLPVAAELGQPLRAALTAADPERAAAPVLEAVEILLARQRRHGLPTPDTGVEAFHGRPARTVGPEVAGLLRASVTDPELAALPADLGSVEQWVRHHEVLSQPERRATLRRAYWGRGMINGAHVILYSTDADADRAFLRDVLGFPHVDAGHDWLIFKLPPAEVALHPTDGPPRHEFYLMCDDLDATLADLASRGVEVSGPVSRERWGTQAAIRLPSGADLGLYQPSHPVAYDLEG